MKKHGLIPLLWGAALLAFGAGLLLCVRAFDECKQSRMRLVDKANQLETVTAIVKRVTVARADRADSTAQANEPTSSLPAFLKQSMPQLVLDDHRERSLPVDDAWALREAELTFNDVAIATGMTAVERVEAQNGRWRLHSCEVRSSPYAKGRGQMILVFRALVSRQSDDSVDTPNTF